MSSRASARSAGRAAAAAVRKKCHRRGVSAAGARCPQKYDRGHQFGRSTGRESVASGRRSSFLQLAHQHHPELFGLGGRKVGHEPARPDFLGLRHDPDVGGARGGAHGEREGNSDFHVRSPVAPHSAENSPPAQRRSARRGVAQERADERREVAPVRQRRERLAAPRPDQGREALGTVLAAAPRVGLRRKSAVGVGADVRRLGELLPPDDESGRRVERAPGRTSAIDRTSRTIGWFEVRLSNDRTRGGPGPRSSRDFRCPAPAFPRTRGRRGQAHVAMEVGTQREPRRLRQSMPP